MPFSKEPPEQGDTPKLAEGESRGFEFNWKFLRHPTKLCWGRLYKKAEDKEFMVGNSHEGQGEGHEAYQRLVSVKFEGVT